MDPEVVENIDHIKVDFRQNQSIVIPYIMLFFSGTGGMIKLGSCCLMGIDLHLT